jgi:hypothetical protein
LPAGDGWAGFIAAMQRTETASSRVAVPGQRQLTCRRHQNFIRHCKHLRLLEGSCDIDQGIGRAQAFAPSIGNRNVA